MKVIEVKNLTYKIEDEEILKDISLSVEKGEFISLLGSNGSGKSTLAKLIAGLGDTDNLPIEKETTPGIVLENPDNQIIGTIVEEDILFGLQNIHITKNEMFKKLEQTVERFKIEDIRKKSVFDLSGGQKQKLAFASLWALEYDIYLLDEVTSMLDAESKKEINSLIRELVKEGKTVIQITHFIEETEDCDRIVILNNGTIIKEGKPSEVLADKKLLEDNYLI